MDERELIEHYVQTLDHKTQQNVTILDRDTLGQRYVFHMSTDPKIKRFIPMVSRRTMHTENRNVPRISVAPHLGGAILGYSAMDMDFFNLHQRDGFRGGWYLYAFEFTYGLAPKKKVLPDSGLTDELWLVPYSPEHWEYTPIKSGRFFMTELKFVSQAKGEGHWASCELVVENTLDEPIALTPKESLAPGYSLCRLDGCPLGSGVKNITVLENRSISKGEFSRLKRINASLLDHGVPLASLNW